MSVDAYSSNVSVSSSNPAAVVGRAATSPSPQGGQQGMCSAAGPVCGLALLAPSFDGSGLGEVVFKVVKLEANDSATYGYGIGVGVAYRDANLEAGTLGCDKAMTMG